METFDNVDVDYLELANGVEVYLKKTNLHKKMKIWRLTQMPK